MVEVYTDGAYSSSRNQGGWAFVVLNDGVKSNQGYGGVFNTTNNRMEIQSALEALKYLRENCIFEATLFSDSMYLIGTMTLNWKKKKNIDLWIEMDNIITGMSITWKHVKGHEGDKYNEHCDMLAVHGSNLILD